MDMQDGAMPTAGSGFRMERRCRPARRPSTHTHGGNIVKSLVRIWMLSFAALWGAGHAVAQDAASGPSNDCPALPDALAAKIGWEVKRFPGILQCNAVLQDGGTEVFALTVSEQSPFKPRRGDRAEKGTLANGEELQWYRGELASETRTEVREALLRISRDRVVHVFLRAETPEALAERQQMVASLPFPAYREN